VILEAFPTSNQRCGLAWFMVGFACLALPAITITARYLPETKGLQPEKGIAAFERKAGPNDSTH
jgi:hypothetical protein